MACSFQAIILAGGTDSKLNPLPNPTSLLPVANREILEYQLDQLEHGGFSEVLVAAREEFFDQVDRVVSARKSRMSDNGKLRQYDVVAIKGLGKGGTMEALDYIIKLNRINRDFVVLCGDFVGCFDLKAVCNAHLQRNATATVVYYEDTSGKLNEETTDYVAIDSLGSNRLLFSKSLAKSVQTIKFPTRMLQMYPRAKLSRSLVDTHVTVFSHRVLSLLSLSPSLSHSSIDADVIPHLISLQFEEEEREREREDEGEREEMGLEELMGKAMSLSISAKRDVFDKVKVYAHVLENTHLAVRINSMFRYFEANREVAKMTPGHIERSKAWPKWFAAIANANAAKGTTDNSHDKQGRRTSVDKPETKTRDISDNLCDLSSLSLLGDKMSLKKNIIGADCEIHNNTKLTNCIIMNEVKICEGVTLVNCVVCHGAVIGAHASLTDCQIGPGEIVAEKRTAKAEIINSSSRRYT